MLKSKISVKRNQRASNEAIYENSDNSGDQEPVFKPGNTPHLRYGNDVLNARQDWAQLLRDIRANGYSIRKIAKYVGVKQVVIKQVLNNEYQRLDFRGGAKIATLHFRCHPEQHEILQ